MPMKKGNPGCPCCCGDCEAPTPVSTGSSAEETAWYLIPDDSNSVTFQDRASWHSIRVASPATTTFIDPDAVFPGPWAKLRLYFAWEDDDNCIFAEIWGVGRYIGLLVGYDYYVRVVAMSGGVESVVASYEDVTTTGGGAANNMWLGATYDESTGIARVVSGVANNANTGAWRTYTRVDTGSGYYSGNYGIRYGWGYGEISGSPSFTLSSATSNSRHINLCQGFPWLFYNGQPTTLITHPWYKTTMPETVTAEVSGVGSCSECNGTQTMIYLPFRRMATVWEETTGDLSNSGGIAQATGSNEYETGWIATLPSTLGTGEAEWMLRYVLRPNQAFVTFAIILRWRQVIAPEFGGGYFYSADITAAYQAIALSGGCNQYDGANALDGLIFDNWTLTDFSGWEDDGGDANIPDLSGVEVELGIP